MLDILKRVLRLVESSERRQFFLLLALSAVAAVVQTLAILAVMPFIMLLASPELLTTNYVIVRIYDLTGANSYAGFLALLGTFAIVVLSLGNLFVAIEHWLSSRFVALLGHRIESTVVRRLLHQPYDKHVAQHSARLSDVVLSQVERVVEGILGSFIVLISNFVLTSFIVLMLVIVSLKSTLITLAGLLLVYLAIFLLLRRKIGKHGQRLTELSGDLFTHTREVLDGVQEIKVRKAEDYFAGRFEAANLKISRLGIHYEMLSFLPHFLLETLVFVGLVAIALYFVLTTQSPGSALSYIALYGIAVYRLVPALQGIFESASEIHHDADALRVVEEQLHVQSPRVQQRTISPPRRVIGWRHASYRFDGSADRQVDDVSLAIPVGNSLCLFGPSGSGKTTLLNLLAGLLTPQGGEVYCDESVLGSEVRDGWRAMIGYCPQNVFLFAESVASNIAFGVPAEEVDEDRVRIAARLARVDEFVEQNLPQRFDSVIGEDGKTLSGGQRQRLGIARALYHDPDILLFDESFTGLDAANKTTILDNLFAQSGKTLIFASHETGVAARCDKVAVIDQGRLAAHDTYSSLAVESKRDVVENGRQ